MLLDERCKRVKHSQVPGKMIFCKHDTERGMGCILC